MSNGHSICGHTFKMVSAMMMIIRDVGWSIGHSIYGHTFKMTSAMMMMIVRDVGDRHYSEVQRHPGGRVSTKVIHVKVIVAIVDENRRHISE